MLDTLGMLFIFFMSFFLALVIAVMLKLVSDQHKKGYIRLRAKDDRFLKQ